MRLGGVLETCLYAADLAAAERFYAGLLGLEVIGRAPDRHVFFRAGDGVFLVFNPARTRDAAGEVGGVPVPSHGTSGAGHVAFRVASSELDAWRARLESAGIAIEAAIDWPRGGRSFYLRDPAGNSIELASPTIWGIAED